MQGISSRDSLPFPASRARANPERAFRTLALRGVSSSECPSSSQAVQRQTDRAPLHLSTSRLEPNQNPGHRRYLGCKVHDESKLVWPVSWKLFHSLLMTRGDGIEDLGSVPRHSILDMLCVPPYRQSRLRFVAACDFSLTEAYGV